MPNEVYQKQARNATQCECVRASSMHQSNLNFDQRHDASGGETVSPAGF